MKPNFKTEVSGNGMLTKEQMARTKEVKKILFDIPLEIGHKFNRALSPEQIAALHISILDSVNKLS